MIFNNDKAIYIQIADYFFEQILIEKFIPESRVLSVRELAVQLEVNPNTVMRTYQYLQEREIIYNKRGIGYFVSEKALLIVKKIKRTTFLEEELPKVFKTMELLGISIEDLSCIKNTNIDVKK